MPISIIKHGTSKVGYFICEKCLCEYTAYPADCYRIEGKYYADCPECGNAAEETFLNFEPAPPRGNAEIMLFSENDCKEAQNEQR